MGVCSPTKGMYLKDCKSTVTQFALMVKMWHNWDQCPTRILLVRLWTIFISLNKYKCGKEPRYVYKIQGFLFCMCMSACMYLYAPYACLGVPRTGATGYSVSPGGYQDPNPGPQQEEQVFLFESISLAAVPIFLYSGSCYSFCPTASFIYKHDINFKVLKP